MCIPSLASSANPAAVHHKATDTLGGNYAKRSDTEITTFALSYSIVHA